ncbi:MAG TPA: TMEM175 family protein [bacterium]|nr:TMEM175 family protein [bacterium]
MNKARFEAFSDGVFAFAITLLILGIALPEFKNPPPAEGELARALLRLWPNLVAYALSFAVIGIMWQNHHALFRLVHRVNRATVFWNLVLLGVTAFIPFATSTLGAYPFMRPATFLYGLTLTGASTAYNLLLAQLVRSGAFASHVSQTTIRQTTIAYRVGWVTYGIAMLTSLAAPILSFALYLLVVGYYLIPRGADTDLAGTSAQD